MYAVKPFRYALSLEPSNQKVRKPRRVERVPLPALEDAQLADLRIDQLREALRRNSVSFPSQIPVFERLDRPDLQWKVAQLYFLFGWSSSKIASRYGTIGSRIGQVLRTWTRKAIAMGYIQFIPDLDKQPMVASAVSDAMPPFISPAQPMFPLADIAPDPASAQQ